MARYVILTEEVFLRHKELVNDEGKRSAKEMLYLYMLILFYCWGTPVCKKTIREICDIHGLEYHNSTRRAKILRAKGWIEADGKYYRPLLVYSPNSKKSVKITPKIDENSVNFTPENTGKSVKITLAECKDYTETDENSVNFTPAYKEGISFLNTNDLNPTTAAEKNAAAAAESNGHKSKYSLEDCLRYAEICIERGEPIKNPHGLATKAYQSGELDLFIHATLYPEPIEQTIEYDDGEAPNGEPQPLDEYELLDARDLLKSALENNQDLSEFKSFYTPEDWQWLMAQVR